MSWFTRRSGGKSRKGQQVHRSVPFRPRVELMEQRCLPAVVVGPVAINPTAIGHNALVANTGIKANGSNGALAIAAIELRNATVPNEALPPPAAIEFGSDRIAWSDAQLGKVDGVVANQPNFIRALNEDSGWEEADDNGEAPPIEPTPAPAPMPAPPTEDL